MSVKDVVDEIRRVAADYGFGPLPLAKARNAVSLIVYGAPYSAAVASERAGTLPLQSGIDAAGVERVVSLYGVDAEPLLAAVLEVFERDDDADEEGFDDDECDEELVVFEKQGDEGLVAAVAAIRRLVERVEHESATGGRSWAEYADVDEVLHAHADEEIFALDEDDGDMWAIVDDAISSDGRSLPKDLAELASVYLEAMQVPSALDTAWIDALAKRNARRKRRPRKTRDPFRFVVVFWVSPDFGAVERDVIAGRAAPPRVDLHEVDYEVMAATLGELFAFPDCAFRVPNDAIDLTVPQRRLAGADPGDPWCEDFARLLLAEAKRSKGPVVDVRAAWRTLQWIKDRRNAPPPSAIPVVVEAHDFEAGMHRLVMMRLRFGITAGTPESLWEPENATFEGKLGTRLREYLESIFGVKYLDDVLLGEPFCERVPDWVDLAEPKQSRAENMRPSEPIVPEKEASVVEQRGGSAGTPVYRPQIGTQFDAAALSGVGRFVPEATAFEIVFGALTTEAEVYRTHIAERVVVEFPGKRRLEIEGAYLWKFLELEIPGLGTPLGGWLESNPYGPGTAEGLAKRIRAAYWALFVDHVDKYALPPISARIDLMRGDVTIVARREIAADTIDAMCQAVLDAMPSDRVDELARSLAVKRLASPRSKLEFRPDPEFPGALRNTLVTSEWPSQVRAMSVGEFFRELAPDDGAERRGPIPSLMERLNDGLGRAGDEALDEWFDLGRGKRGHPARALAEALGLQGRIGARDERRRRLLEAVALSPAHSVVEQTLFKSFYDRWWDRRLGELLDGA